MGVPRLIERPIPLPNTYSLLASITSSRDNIPSLAPKKKVGIMLPSINRFSVKEGCLLNKPIAKTERCFDQTTMALNHLSAKILEDDPLA